MTKQNPARPLVARPLVCLAAAALLSTASAARSTSSKLLWSVSDASQIYGSASLARNQGGATFAVGTDFGASQYADIVSQSGKVLFRITPSDGCNGSCDLYVDSARHLGGAPGAPSVDTFVLQTGDGSCTVFGYVTAGPKASSTPAWTTLISGCDTGEGVGGTYRCFEASDDGSVVVLQGYAKDKGTGNTTTTAYAIDAQTGEKRWEYALGLKEAAGQGDISVTTDGAFVSFINEDSVPTPNSAQMHVIEGATGKLRAEVQIPFFIAGAISDDGNTLAIQNFTHLVGSQGWILKWSGAKYELVHRVNLPPDGTEYDEWDTAITTASDGTTVVVYSWIQAGSVLRLRVNSWNAETGDLMMDWTAPPNTKFQNNPTLMCDGDYVAVALWGDDGDKPTAVLLNVHSNQTLFEHVSPGSMMAVDVAVDKSTATEDVILLNVAGKNVPANEGGTGGNAYVFEITVAK